VKLGARGKLHLEGCTFSGFDSIQMRTVHLHDRLGDGEPEAGPTFSLSVGAVDLMELLEDARLMFHGNARPVSVTLTAK
jgi:hypothetical protein